MKGARKWRNAGAALTLTIIVAGCSAGGPSPSALTGTPAPTATSGSSAPATTGASPTDVDESQHMSIAFFGYSKANSFSNAAFEYIKEYAQAHNADATFFDGGFDWSGATQARQIQDATTSGKYQVFIIMANETTAIVPPILEAVRKGIAVVAEFGPIGERFDTKEPQVEGTMFVGDVPTQNGQTLGQLGLKACEQFPAPCKVAYIVGFKALPLDTARTQAAVDTLRAGGATVWDNYEGGYTSEGGRKAGQDIFQAHPDVNVIIGASSQAITGVEAIVPEQLKGRVLLIGNGGSEQAVTAVREGRWFATYVIPLRAEAMKAAEIGLAKARGATLTQLGYSYEDLGAIVEGTRENLRDFKGDYVDD